MTEDTELDALRSVLASLTPLDSGARERVVGWIIKRLDIKFGSAADEVLAADPSAYRDERQARTRRDESPVDRYETMAELFAAINPKTGGQKALVVGYWKQVKDEVFSFDAQSINTELKHMGHHVPNITEAMNELQRHRPQLAVQLKKAGTTRQARKTYKVTTEGIRVVEGMLNGATS
jgi:hypothetical protein